VRVNVYAYTHTSDKEDAMKMPHQTKRRTSRPGITRTTVEIANALHQEAKIRAIREGRDLRDLFTDALTAYLKTPLLKKEGRR